MIGERDVRELVDTRMKRIGYRPPLDQGNRARGSSCSSTTSPDGRIAAHHAQPAARRQRRHDCARGAAHRDPRDHRRPVPPCASPSSPRAGDRAFSVGGDLYERKQMTKEEWLRQRQVFDRVLLQPCGSCAGRFSPRSTGWPTAAAARWPSAPDFIIASDDSRFRAARGDGRPVRRRRLTGLPPPAAPSGQGHADADDRRADHGPGGLPTRHGQRGPSLAQI